MFKFEEVYPKKKEIKKNGVHTEQGPRPAPWVLFP